MVLCWRRHGRAGGCRNIKNAFTSDPRSGSSWYRMTGKTVRTAPWKLHIEDKINDINIQTSNESCGGSVRKTKTQQHECNKNNWFNFIVNSMRIAMQKKQFHSVVTLYQLNEIKRKNFIRGQAKKSTRWMPWHWEPTKDVISCDKPR